MYIIYANMFTNNLAFIIIIALREPTITEH